jgi:hypothetical protein
MWDLFIEGSMIEEQWSVIEEFPNYAISNIGRVKRLVSRTCAKAGSILKTPARSKDRPYPSVDLCAEGKRRTEMVHILVARAFLAAPTFVGAEVNHRNGDKTDPAHTNLEWTTSSGNTLHAYEEGLADAKGECNGQSKLTEAQVLTIRANVRGVRGEISRIARESGVSSTTIRDVIRRRTWNHI